MSVGATEATRHPELVAAVAAVAGWLAAPELAGATVVLFDGRHAEDLAGFDWPEYRVRDSTHSCRARTAQQQRGLACKEGFLACIRCH